MGVEVAVGGLLLAGFSESRQARRRERRAADVNRRVAGLQRQRQAQASVNEAQAQRAELLQKGVNQGVEGASVVEGGIGAILTQVSSNIGFANTVQDLQNQASDLLQSAARSRQNAQFAAQAASIVSGVSAPTAPATVSQGAALGTSSPGNTAIVNNFNLGRTPESL